MKQPAASGKRPYAKRAVVPVSIRLEQNLMPLAECGCWIWMGNLSDLGYGKMKIEGKSEGVHRVSWTEHRGKIPEGQNVLHSCDIRCCFNPDHLFLGSQSENVADMMNKGRNSPMRGEDNPNAKLTAAQVQQIRESFAWVCRAWEALRRWQVDDRIHQNWEKLDAAMSIPAFRGSYSDWKLVKTRGVIQVIFEIPLADSDAAYEVLGGMPDGSKERWFGIAAINLGKEAMPNPVSHDSATGLDNARPEPSPPARAKRDWRGVQPSAQAALRCDQAPFWAFLREEYKHRVTCNDDAATAVRKICGVNSRAHFNDNHVARVAWHQLDSQFQAWQAKERVGA